MQPTCRYKVVYVCNLHFTSSITWRKVIIIQSSLEDFKKEKKIEKKTQQKISSGRISTFPATLHSFQELVLNFLFAFDRKKTKHYTIQGGALSLQHSVTNVECVTMLQHIKELQQSTLNQFKQYIHSVSTATPCYPRPIKMTLNRRIRGT